MSDQNNMKQEYQQMNQQGYPQQGYQQNYQQGYPQQGYQQNYQQGYPQQDYQQNYQQDAQSHQQQVCQQQHDPVQGSKLIGVRLNDLHTHGEIEQIIQEVKKRAEYFRERPENPADILIEILQKVIHTYLLIFADPASARELVLFRSLFFAGHKLGTELLTKLSFI